MGMGCFVCGNRNAGYQVTIHTKKDTEPTTEVIPNRRNLDYPCWLGTYGICSKECFRKLVDIGKGNIQFMEEGDK